MRKLFGFSTLATLAPLALIPPTPAVAADATTPTVARANACPRSEYGPDCRCGKAHMLRMREVSGQPIGESDPTPGAGVGYEPRELLTDTDLLTVDLDIEVNPANDNITGSNTMRVRSLVNNLTQFTFNLRSQYAISSATINGTTAVTVAAPGANSYARRVTLNRAYAAGEEFTLRIAYSGTAVSRGFGSITFGTQNGTPIISTLSEAYFAGTWWPVKDGDFQQPGDNGDKSTGSIAITVPDTLKVVSNGLLTSTTTPAAGKARYRWTTGYPTSTYLYFFSATNYNQWQRTYTYPLAGGGSATMPVQFSIYPASDTAGNRAAWERVLDMLPVFRGVFGEYPFVNEKYGIYQFPFGGGMEHQTYTGQGTFNESVTAHELGHQWWGDDVTCKTWKDIWLNEGFATYSEALWEENRPGSTGFPALKQAMQNRRPAATNDSVYVYDTSNMNRIFSGTFSYDKGSWVLHQMRRVVGDATFFNILATYRAQFSGRGAITEDFKNVASAVSGRDLTGFFNQWVYAIGAPDYAYGWQNAVIDGRNYLRLSIRQVQSTTWGNAGVFEMPIDIRISGNAGTTNVVVNNTARTQHYLIPLAAPATNVLLDDDGWILTENKTAGAYVNGPPKIVAVTLGPTGGPGTSPAYADVVFSEPVNAAATAFTITGPGGAPVSFTYALIASGTTARLTFVAPPTGGSYTLTVADSVASVAIGAVLDGEVVAGSLPSGNGLPGGAASIRFTVGSCVADVDDGSGAGTPDGGVDINDLLYYLAIFDAGVTAADVDDGSGSGTPDGGVDINDLLYYLQRFDAGC